MKAGYKIERTFPYKNTMLITVSNYKSLNEVVNFYWTGNKGYFSRTENTIGIWRIKWKN